MKRFSGKVGSNRQPGQSTILTWAHSLTFVTVIGIAGCGGESAEEGGASAVKGGQAVDGIYVGLAQTCGDVRSSPPSSSGLSPLSGEQRGKLLTVIERLKQVDAVVKAQQNRVNGLGDNEKYYGQLAWVRDLGGFFNQCEMKSDKRPISMSGVKRSGGSTHTFQGAQCALSGSLANEIAGQAKVMDPFPVYVESKTKFAYALGATADSDFREISINVDSKFNGMRVGGGNNSTVRVTQTDIAVESKELGAVQIARKTQYEMCNDSGTSKKADGFQHTVQQIDIYSFGDVRAEVVHRSEDRGDTTQHTYFLNGETVSREFQIGGALDLHLQ